jgi:hypothetical protein
MGSALEIGQINEFFLKHFFLSETKAFLYQPFILALKVSLNKTLQNDDASVQCQGLTPRTPKAEA